VPDRIFLDANVIFSAAYRRTTELRRLWALPDLTLLTSLYATSEGERNLHPTRHSDLQVLLQAITLVPTPQPGDRPLPSTLVLPAKDAPIYQAAAAAEATHLFTGDRRHFGAYYGQQFERVLILTPGTYIRSRIPGDP
jgi:predicted nucleic acid-binding protein